MFQQVVMRFATRHQLPSEGPHIVSTWTHRSSRQPWHCMCSSETNTTNPQLLLQSSGSTGTTKAGTAQIWARPSRREREHWRRALDAAGNSRDRSRLWTWMHATGKEKDPIRPYCCTQAIPWLGTRHCDKLSKSCSTHCTARACTKNNAKKKYMYNREGTEALGQTMQPAHTFKWGHASLTLPGTHTTRRSQVFSAWASSAHKNTNRPRLFANSFFTCSRCF